MDDTEKAARIRALMEAYRQDLDGLPAEVREFLSWVENQATEGDIVND